MDPSEKDLSTRRENRAKGSGLPPRNPTLGFPWIASRKNGRKRGKMTDKVIENNQVTVMGEIVSGFTYSHQIYGEGFYMMDVKCNINKKRI